MNLRALYEEFFKESNPLELLAHKLLEILSDLEKTTKSHWIVYWATIDDIQSDINIITNRDLEIFRDMIRNRNYKNKLFLDITSPGGKIEAAEAIMRYLTKKFNEIHAVVPFIAKSAATLICFIASEIYMADYSFLGSISPLVGTGIKKDAVQVIKEFNETISNIGNININQRRTNNYDDANCKKQSFNPDPGTSTTENDKGITPKDSSTHAPTILTELSKKDQETLNIILSSFYDPIIRLGFPLFEAREAIKWVENVARWALNNYHFKGEGEKDNKEHIDNIIKQLLNNPNIIFHNRNISREEIKQVGLNIKDLDSEENKDLENKILEIQNIMRLLEQEFNCVKIIASSNQEIRIIQRSTDKVFNQNTIPEPNQPPYALSTSLTTQPYNVKTHYSPRINMENILVSNVEVRSLTIPAAEIKPRVTETNKENSSEEAYNEEAYNN
ncbi:MAG: hypothetical protein ACTSWN_02745, partial [Promethearchaeota archaeon]